MYLIKDPYYLSRQVLFDVKEHQVPGLIQNIKAMITLCRNNGLENMSAPEAGLPYKFFIAKNPDPRDPDFEVVFSPKIMATSEEESEIEELFVSGNRGVVVRYNVIEMEWFHHNGRKFEKKSGVFEGELAFIAQKHCERLDRMYRIPNDIITSNSTQTN